MWHKMDDSDLPILDTNDALTSVDSEQQDGSPDDALADLAEGQQQQQQQQQQQPEVHEINERLSGRLAHAHLLPQQTKLVTVPSSAVANSQPAMVAAAALGIPVSISGALRPVTLTSTGAGGLTFTTAGGGSANGGGCVATSAISRGGGGTGLTLVPVTVSGGAAGGFAVSNSIGGGSGVTFVPVTGRRVLVQVGGGGLLSGGVSTTTATVVAVQSRSTTAMGLGGQAGQQQTLIVQRRQPVSNNCGGGGSAGAQQLQLQHQAAGAPTVEFVMGGGGDDGGGGSQRDPESSSNQLVCASSTSDITTTIQVPARVVLATTANQQAQAVQHLLQTHVTDQSAAPSSPPAAAAAVAPNASVVAAAAAEHLAAAVSAAANAASSNDNDNDNRSPSPNSSSTLDPDSSSTTNNASSAGRMFDPGCASYTTLTSPQNGRMTPPGGYIHHHAAAVSNSYATLTPLQPLPPISTISSMQDKFQAYSPGSNVSGAFIMQNNLQNISLGSPYNSYEKLGMSPPHTYAGQIPSGAAIAMGMHGQQSHSPSALSPTHHYSQNGLHSSKQEPLSPSAAVGYYDPAQRPSPHDLSPHSLEHSPNSANVAANAYGSSQVTPLTSNNNPSLNGGAMTSVSPHTISPVPHPSPGGNGLIPHLPPSPPPHPSHHTGNATPSAATIITSLHNSNHPHLFSSHVTQHSVNAASMVNLKSIPNTTSSAGGGGGSQSQSSSSSGGGGEAEEINTKELAQRISAELKRYSIPQAIFAQRVLCRSQGTLSDLLRNPKPWSKLKSGRETFRRMAKWLQEPEFQRMSSLRLAGKEIILLSRLLTSPLATLVHRSHT
jgi:hypothetical protein